MAQKQGDAIMNYYEILEITEKASQEVIKAAYRALAKKYHPDSYNGTESERQKNMVLINEAYDVLSNTQKRRAYDLKLKSQKDNKDEFQEEKSTEFKQNDAYYKDSSTESVQKNGQNKCSQGEPEEASTKAEHHSHNIDYEDSEEAGGSGRFGRIIQGIGREIAKTIQENNREIENAYLDGISMDDYFLVRKFKQAKGYKRIGYAKALEEKGLLERDCDGKLVPTYKYKSMF